MTTATTSNGNAAHASPYANTNSAEASQAGKQTGETIGLALIAPAGCAPEAANPIAIERGIAVLQARGFAVENYYQHEARHLRFGGTDQARLQQIEMALENPAIKVVMALRGSYGVSRLLDGINFAKIAASGKIFVGYSDLTALSLALLAQTGASSYSGPMLCDDYSRETPIEFTLQQFESCLQGPNHCIEVQQSQDGLVANSHLSVEGQLWGGNLAMINSLLGTPYFPRVKGGILFVEDISEHPYRVERMLLQLMHAGVLEQQQALILGDFSAYRLSPYDNGYDFASMLGYLRKKLSIPVLTGLPYGHITERACLPIGAHAQLQADGAGFQLKLTNYACLMRSI